MLISAFQIVGAVRLELRFTTRRFDDRGEDSLPFRRVAGVPGHPVDERTVPGRSRDPRHSGNEPRPEESGRLAGERRLDTPPL